MYIYSYNKQQHQHGIYCNIKTTKKEKKEIKKKQKQKDLSKQAIDKDPNIDDDEVKDISEVDQEAVVVQRVIPKYPVIAQKAGLECKVLLEVIINEKGRVASAKVVYVSQKGYGFEKNALQAVKKIRFKPFIQDNKAVKVKVIYPIDFVLIE